MIVCDIPNGREDLKKNRSTCASADLTAAYRTISIDITGFLHIFLRHPERVWGREGFKTKPFLGVRQSSPLLAFAAAFILIPETSLNNLQDSEQMKDLTR